MPKHHSEDYKITAVKHYINKSKNLSKTCKIFRCSERSLMRWVKKYQTDGNVKRKSRKYVAYKMKKEYVKFIKDELKKNKTLPVLDLTAKLNDKYKTKFNRSHIRRVIRDNNITLKQTRIRHEPKTRFRKPVDINKQLKDFYKEISKYKLEDIICIDETSLNSYEVRKHCYETIDKRCVVKTTSQEVFKKYTGIFAITNKKCIGYEIYKKGGIDSERLKAFINKYITEKYKKKLIILDNASSHRNQSVKDLINKDNKILYSVPYQHYTNSIENFFSILKSKLRKTKSLGYDKLQKNIKEVLKLISEQTYKRIFIGNYMKKKKYTKKKSNREKTLKNYL